MQCVICTHGETAPGNVTVTLQRGETVVVVKEVPADVCRQCGECYVDGATTARFFAMAEEAVQHRVEVEIPRYAA